MTKLPLLLRQSARLLALLIIISALPAFAQDEPYEFELTDDGSGYIMKPRYNMTYEGVLDVPAVRESNGIPIVGVDGFSYQERLLGIQFFEGSQVKSIGSFQGCTGIEFIADMPATVETIADYAFQGCERLRDVTLNDGLKYIGISCFEGCEMLTSIKLPKSLKVLRESAFRVCTGLQTVEFEDGVDFYDANGGYHFYNNVFDGCENLTEVKLPKNSPGNFIIPMGTFQWCGNLKSIEFPANTRRIDQMAFYRTGIENLDLTTITSNEIFVEGYYTFAACESLKTVTVNGNFQFGNTSLYTFQGCKALETVTVNGSGDDYIAITPDAFRWCTNLRSVKVYRLKGTGDVNNEMDSVFVGCTKLEEVISTCDPELNKIGYSCFDGCESLKTVTLPEQGSFKINETAFRGCSALQSLNLANVTLIGTKAFTGCSALTSLSINNMPEMENVNAFDEWHFANTEIAVPDEKYSTFTSDAYWGKFSIKHPSLFAYNEVSGGYSVSKSQYALDEDLTGMLMIPGQYKSGDVVAIAANAFQGLTGITGVTLPEVLTSIGNNAFGGCTGITTVINKAAQPLTGDVCPQTIFDTEVYSSGNLTVPFGSGDAYSASAPWENFSNRINQGFGERVLSTPQFSLESGEFNKPFELTLTNPNDAGTIYYYIVSEGENTDVHTVLPYSTPININSSCKVVVYVTDGTNCSEPNSFECNYVINSTENGLDKVLNANAGDYYRIATNLHCHYHDGTYLYASTIANSGSSKNAFNEDKKTESLSDKESDFIQEDWVAISGLTSDYVGKVIESGNTATVVSNTDYPVISFDEDVTATASRMDINTYRVENFNIHADNAAVNNIWLVAPQPAEYCSVKGFLSEQNIHEAEGYLVLQSAESATTTRSNAAVEPLTLNVYYDAANIKLDTDGWYYFTGVVSKENDALKYTAFKASDKPIYTAIDDVDAGTTRIFAANGSINVAADKQTTIAVYSANGQLVAAIEASSATIALTPGFYIVRVGTQVTKLAVR